MLQSHLYHPITAGLGKSLCLVLLFSAVFSGASAAQAPQDVTALEPGRPLDRELTGEPKHSYRFTLGAGQYALIVVEQRGVDLVEKLFAEDGKQLGQFDSDVRPQGQDKLEIVGDAGASYTLTVEAKYKKAATGRYQIQIAEVRDATPKDLALQEARKLLVEFARLGSAGKYTEAGPLIERVLTILEAASGTESLAFGLALNNAGMYYSEIGDYPKALAFLERARTVLEKTLGADHVKVSDAISNLGIVYRTQGNLATAETLYRQALAIRQKAVGEEHPYVAVILNNLGNLVRAKGDYVQAEELLSKALKIREHWFGPGSPEMANALVSLAIVYFEKKDFLRMADLNQQALAIREKLFPPEHPQITLVLTNLALAYSEMGDYAKAEPMMLRVIDNREKTYGKDNIQIATPLLNLANLYFDLGSYAKAEELYLRINKIQEKALPPGHPDIALTVSNLGSLYYFQGDYAKAEPLYLRALDLRVKALGPEHPTVAESLNELARLYEAKRDVEQALSFQRRANVLLERQNTLNLFGGSERGQLAYFDFLNKQTHQTLTLHLGLSPRNQTSGELAVTTIIQRKGRVQDKLADSFAVLRRRLNADDRRLLDQLNETTAELAKLVLDGPQKAPVDQHQKQIKGLEEKREKLEVDISRRSSGFYQQTQPITLMAVRESIPEQTALVEFALYRPFDAQAKNKADNYGKPRYVAYVVRRQGEVLFTELGDAGMIDWAIDAFRQTLRDPKRKETQQLARSVDEKIMQPVRKLLGGATHLLISPDGALNLIPFEALVDEQGRYLLERYAFTYLTSGRDLLRMQVARESKGHPLIIADPLFGEPTIAQTTTGEARKTRPAGLDRKRQSITTGTDMSNVYFAPLGGTAGEARVIKSLFAEAEVLTGTQATESAVKQIAVPRILHIATHGFFLTDAPGASPADGENLRAIAANAKIANPLLRSGLALAGANLKTNQTDDGILTALEASSLNLWGTKLVTLSACDTGVGEVRNGEGVYGLRRAFVLAGAETLVMSLWAVSDYVTREMMSGYYKNLKQGLGRGQALREVQLEMLKRKGREHPFYWASFIQAGEWANLDGKR